MVIYLIYRPLSHPLRSLSKLTINNNNNNYIIQKFKSACFKWTYGLYGNGYRVDTLSNSYLTVIGIVMQSLKSIVQF